MWWSRMLGLASGIIPALVGFSFLRPEPSKPRIAIVLGIVALAACALAWWGAVCVPVRRRRLLLGASALTLGGLLLLAPHGALLVVSAVVAAAAAFSRAQPGAAP